MSWWWPVAAVKHSIANTLRTYFSAEGEWPRFSRVSRRHDNEELKTETARLRARPVYVVRVRARIVCRASAACTCCAALGKKKHHVNITASQNYEVSRGGKKQYSMFKVLFERLVTATTPTDSNPYLCHKYTPAKSRSEKN